MKKTINFLATCTVFALTIQFYVLKSETTLAQTNEGVSNELFRQGNKEMERDKTEQRPRVGGKRADPASPSGKGTLPYVRCPSKGMRCDTKPIVTVGQNLESGNDRPDDNEIERQQQSNNEEINSEELNREQLNNDQIEREELNLDNNEPNREEINRQEQNVDEKLDRTGSLEEHKPKKPRIRDVKAPNYGRGNVPDQPPKNEVEVEF
ncbi:hypothetical protein [Pleurocapsa sp. FMAR1]|uniref:hypothetical protein n=1 Tax=Pleurocapsa sp. FMAR1 TaxID=3040204 RepID=UPI0029C7EAA7|nr:hypothetical protein [Pleurocapsa sp. FMAR1]